MLCVVALAFSYSCKCRNNPEDPTRVNGGAISGNYTIQIDSAGTGYQQEAKVSFASATATLKSIEDVDSGLASDDFVYEGNILKLKAGADSTSIDSTVANKITWDGITNKKIKATFTLTPTADNVDLDSTEKTVEITIKKVKKVDDFQAFLRQVEKIDVGSAPNVVSFDSKNGTYATGTFTVKTDSSSSVTISKSTLAKNTVYYYKQNIGGFLGAELVANNEAGGGDTDNFYSVDIKFTYDTDNYEVSESDTITFKFEKTSSNLTWAS